MFKNNSLSYIDWKTVIFVFPIIFFGLITMNAFSGESEYASRQLLWFVISLIVFTGFSLIDWRFLKKTNIITSLFFLFCILFITLLVLGEAIRGVKGWFSFGAFSFQPVDFAKVVLIALLAKYFSKRHIQIANWRHILVSGAYTFILFLLVLLQPDFGSAVIIFLIWFGMILVSGISKKHLFSVLFLGLLAFFLLWTFVFADYQKARIATFLNPLSDIHGSGYNAYQSTIAVGSGGIFGKGVGYGTQSRLQFLPEHETDFIFAAFAEEWGFLGVIVLITCYGAFALNVLKISREGATNFESLFGLGFVIMIIGQMFINVGMNIGLLPITGITLPFMSYGGSHLVAEFGALGILIGMKKYGRPLRAVKSEITPDYL